MDVKEYRTFRVVVRGRRFVKDGVGEGDEK